MNKVPVQITWLGPAEGGRPAPPPGPTYSTVAKFEAWADRWPREAWSIVAEWDVQPGAGLVTRARMRLLAADGPQDLLDAGSAFELYEGRRLVARGVVLAT